MVASTAKASHTHGSAHAPIVAGCRKRRQQSHVAHSVVQTKVPRRDVYDVAGVQHHVNRSGKTAHVDCATGQDLKVRQAPKSGARSTATKGFAPKRPTPSTITARAVNVEVSSITSVTNRGNTTSVIAGLQCQLTETTFDEDRSVRRGNNLRSVVQEEVGRRRSDTFNTSSTNNHLCGRRTQHYGHEWTSVNVTSQCSNGTRAVEVNTSSALQQHHQRSA